MHYDVIIVGGGPAGLACAKVAAQAQCRVLLLDRKTTVGTKVCAGGITWNGLMRNIPTAPVEKEFCSQYLFSKYQSAKISEANPIIATVNREKLGQLMFREACEAGADCRFGWQVNEVANQNIRCTHLRTQKKETYSFSYLVGSDGSSSLVRRYLRLPTSHVGIGINYQLPVDYGKMEWHLHDDYFRNGYGWLFPHRDSLSLGAYVDEGVMSARQLLHNLQTWGKEVCRIDLTGYKPQAERINYDYRGYRFDNFFLAGDAAGLASGLTGEGIYPALISGEAVARTILDNSFQSRELARLVKNHRHHQRMVRRTAKSSVLSVWIAELVVFLLRVRLINFKVAEMAYSQTKISS